MGSYSYTRICPKCKNEMNCCSETRSFEVSGECLYCGFLYYTATDRLSLDEVNDLRIEFEMEKIKELVKWEK